MAYLAFGELGGAAMVRAQARPDPTPREEAGAGEAPARLGALEWSVVAHARGDRVSSLAKPSRLAVALRSLFGGTQARLADPRLEALRRLAVLTWTDGYGIPAREVRRFVAAGFSLAQYELVAASIGAARQRGPRTVIA